MAIMKIIFTLAITMAITITLTMQGIRDGEEIKPDPLEHVSVKNVETHADSNNQVFPSKRTSRFLAEVKNHRAADHCHKDNEVCHHQNRNSTCCNNKCMNLSTDRHNCGACKRKCKFTHACCRGECVNLSFDKRHCGHCNNRCEPGQYCVYGMCDYA